MDALDRKLIVLLSDDGRMSITDLADALPLSISATRERLRRLEANGIIAGYGVKLNLAALDRSIEALIDVRLGPTFSTDDVDIAIAKMPAIVHAMHLTGRFDMQLHVVTTDVGVLDKLLTQLREDAGAEETNTRLVLRELDGFPRPPLDLISET